MTGSKKDVRLAEAIAQVTASGLQKLVEAKIIESLKPKVIAEQFLAVDTKLVGTGGSCRSFRKRAQRATLGVLSSYSLTEDTNITGLSTTLSFSTLDVTPTKYCVADEISGAAIEVSDFDLIDQTQDALVDAWARLVDDYIWTQILGATQTTVLVSCAAINTAGSTQNISVYTAYPWLKFVGIVTNASATLISCAKVDYYKGVIQVNNPSATTIYSNNLTVSFWYSTRTSVMDANTKGTAYYDDFVNLRAKLIAYYIDGPDAFVMYPDEYADCLKDSGFRSVSTYGQAVMFNGEIQKISGVPVISNTQFWPGVILCLKGGAGMGFKVLRTQPKVNVEKIPLRDGDLMVEIIEYFGVGIVDDTNIAIVTNIQSNAFASA